MDRRVFVGARVRPRQGREREMDAEVRNCVVVDAEVKSLAETNTAHLFFFVSTGTDMRFWCDSTAISNQHH